MGYLCFQSYSGYRRELIEMEQQQLLTMAETVGKSLVNYVTQELESMDLYFAALEYGQGTDTGGTGDSGGRPDTGGAGDSGGRPDTGGAGDSGSRPDTAGRPDSTASDAIRAAEYFLRQNTDQYEAMVCFDGQGSSICRAGFMEFPWEQLPADSQAVICGKNLSSGGWYQMFVSRRFTLKGEPYHAVYAMNLNRLHSRIVEPVRIGSGGYSIVKDSSLSIIMHHAADQIGMDAVYDRSLRYPDLDLEDLTGWIARQKAEPEGVGVIRSYIWGSPNPLPEKRIVAYTTIHLPGEDWIVNSTLPYRELDDPLNRMLLRLAAIGGLSLALMACFIFGITRSLTRTRSQRKEIQYLKEINAGMELLRHKEEELQHYQRVQSIGQMSSHIAHEFNNYLTPVFVYGELLENDPAIQEDNKALVRGILDAAGQAAALSRRLLDFSRQDSGVALTAIRLTQEVQKACAVIRQLTPQSIVFETRICSQTVCISGRARMIEHLLMNLCNNAFHAMEGREGRLTVTLEADPQLPDGADALPDIAGNRWALLSVTDTGCGISKDVLDKIFEPFYTTKRSGKGTGLGLSVVRNVMTAAGGQIRVRSILGEGTAFDLYFPQISEGQEPTSVRKPIHRIVLVDDDPDILKSMETYLAARGYLCTGYAHPAAVLSRLQQQRQFCDAILTDYAMPSMNGLEFAQLVRKLNPEILLILMSGAEDTRFDWYLANKFIDAFILKSDLPERLAQVLEGGRDAHHPR